MLLLCFPPIIALLLSGQQLQGPARCIHENLYFLAPAQTKRMQPILVSCEAPFRSNLQNNSEGYGPHWTNDPTGPIRITIGARLDSNRVQDRAILLEHHTFRNFAGHFAPVAIFNAIIQVLLPNHLIEF